ncbi:MAG: hypothetical protein ABWY54_01220 [Glaciihabitans sp.]
MIARIALGWSVLGLVVQVIFTALVAPKLGETFDFTIPGRGPTLAVAVDTAVMSTVGVVVTVVAILISAFALLMESRNSRFAYAIGVVVCIVVPGFVGLVTGNGVAAAVTGGDSSIGVSLLIGFVAIVAVMLGALSIVGATKFENQRAAQAG